MNFDRGKASLFGAAAAVRLLLFASPGLPDLLTGRVEVSTPVTSFKRCEFALRNFGLELTEISTGGAVSL